MTDDLTSAYGFRLFFQGEVLWVACPIYGWAFLILVCFSRQKVSTQWLPWHQPSSRMIYILSCSKHTANIRGYFIMLASRVVRQMAAGANKDPGRIRQENQRVVRFLFTAALSWHVSWWFADFRDHRIDRPYDPCLLCWIHCWREVT